TRESQLRQCRGAGRNRARGEGKLRQRGRRREDRSARLQRQLTDGGADPHGESRARENTMDAWIGDNDARTAVPLIAVDAQNVAAVASGFGEAARRWCDAQGFAGESGRFVLLPGADGAPQAVLAGCDARDALHALASLPTRLPAGSYRLD